MTANQSEILIREITDVNVIPPHTRTAAHRVCRTVIGLAAIAAVLLGSSIAAACSQDNATYFETFLDPTCLKVPLTQTTLDALGGLRLDTNGTVTAKLWDTDVNFAGEASLGFPRVGVSTLHTTDSGTAAALDIPTVGLPLTLDLASPVLSPTASLVPDGDHVGGPSIIKVASTYAMYYTGSTEPGGPTVILMATSSDGKVWTRATPNTPVLEGTPGAFDEMGVGSPEVYYDAAELITPYRMWYSGRGKVFGAIGYATSPDGITWTKFTGTANSEDPPVAVLDHGIGGSGDSFSAADPSIIRDGLVWKMWYTGDDSTRKRINYATSVNGIVWQKGGTVLGPESPNVTANYSEGAYAPGVYKVGTTYYMVFSGRKIVSGDEYQTKILSSDSPNGINWSGGSPALNPSGNVSNFDYSNLEAPTVFDEDAAGPEQYKLYYVGNTLDANGNGHDRIGLATSQNGTSFGKFTGGETLDSVLDIGALGTPFDGRGASGIAAAATTGSGANSYVGFYSGTRGTDFVPRIGEATSADAAVWTKVTGTATGGAMFDLGPAAPPASAKNNQGALEPSVLLDGSTYNLYYTGIDPDGARSILRRTSPQDVTTKQPTNVWSAYSQVVAGDGSGFDADGVSHPSVIKDASIYVMHYTGVSSGTPEIGRTTSAAATFTSPTRPATPVIAKGVVGDFDEKGAKDPVVIKLAAGDYRMIYTGIDADGIERLGYATSADATAWTKQGVILNPSRQGFAYDEVGVRPSGMMLDTAGTTLHVYTSGMDRTGRQRAGHATTDPTTTGGIPMGWATYQLGDSASSPQDFRSITRTSTGTGTELWLSFLQPYSNGGADHWSDYFPVTQLSETEQLNLLLTVTAIRWQARLSDPGGAPSLDKVEIGYAPVSFFPTGSATTLNVEPAATLTLTSWGDLTVDTSTFSPAGGGAVGGTVSVLDADTSAVLIAPVALNTNGTTTQPLSAINAAQNPRLRLVFDLTSDGTATPKVESATVTYAAVPLTEPIALFFANPTSGNVPLTVAFDATSSRVPQGRTIVSYHWDFDGNGTVDQVTTIPTTSFTYLGGGTWPAELTITDSTGAVSAPRTVTISALDPTPPTGVLITGPASLSKPFQVRKPLALTWTATDLESTIVSYTLSYRAAPIGGLFAAPVVFLTTTATGATFTLQPGYTYCFTVTARNNVGLTATSPERCTALPLHSYNLTAKGTWAKKSKSGHFLNRYRTAKIEGATLTKSVVAKRIAIVATRGKGMGTVTVYLGTTKLKTIKLAATVTRKRQVIAIAAFTKIRKGTVKIVVTSSDKPVVIEGLGISKI